MSTFKLIPLSDAIGRFVPDGSSVAAGLGLEASIPFAAGHEIMRQRRRGLCLIGPISDILFDQMIGAGCVHRVQAAWVGNVITGSGYNFRRAVESGALRVEDHSNLTIAMALKAAAMGVSFMPVRTALGSDLIVAHPGLKPIACPFTGGPLAAVTAADSLPKDPASQRVKVERALFSFAQELRLRHLEGRSSFADVEKPLKELSRLRAALKANADPKLILTLAALEAETPP